jgi:hypothetical protein
MRVISVISWVMLAVWGFLSLGGANAGTCRNYSEGSDTVQSCDNGHGSARPPAGLWHAERRAGELLKEMAERGERRGSGGDYVTEHGSIEEPSLSDLGVTKKQSHNWQKQGERPVFERRLGA